MSAGMILGGAAIGAATSIGTALANQGLTAKARRENYMYNELASQNADIRARNFYNDFQSPQAQIRQLKEAGLSPSLFYGQAGSSAGYSAPQGNGTSGLAAPIIQNPIDPLTMSQIELNKSIADKNNAETKSTNLQNTIDEFRNYYKEQEFQLITTPLMKKNGEPTSIYELATQSDNYDTFVHEIRTAAKDSNRDDIVNYTQTEIGQTKMREIFLQANRNERDINVLSAENVNAQFKEQLTRELMSTDFVKLNAKDAVQKLETAVSQNELTERQKEAWNNLLRDLEKRNKTAYGIVMILGMLVDRFVGKVNVNSSTKTINKNYHAEI